MPPTRTSTRLFGSAEPTMVGVWTLVMLSRGAPSSLPGPRASPVGVLIAVSICTASGEEGLELLPATSVATALKLWTPSDSGAPTVMLQTPPEAVPVPRTVAPSRSVMVPFSAAVPVIVGVLSLVRLSPAMPESLPGWRVKPAGTPGAMVSMVTASTPEEAVLPATSLVLAVRLCTPSLSAAVRVMLQVPVAPTTVVGKRAVVPSNSCTVLPTGALPVMVGVESLVMLSPTTPESEEGCRARPDGAPGGVVSIVIDRADDTAETLPALSKALAVIWCTPSLSAETVMLQAPVVGLTVPDPISVVPSKSLTVVW